ncbi:hypothetical protein D3C72_2563470 [compost metagenome]
MLKMMYKWTQDFERGRADFESKLQLYEKKVIRLKNTKQLPSVLRDIPSKETRS